MVWSFPRRLFILVSIFYLEGGEEIVMTERKTARKVTRVGGDDTPPAFDSREKWAPTSESRGRASRLRVIAALLWLLAIGCQVWAIALLFQTPINMTWIIVLIVLDLAFVIGGALLWQKSNRLDPASEEQKFRFFIQNQMGLFAAIVAFLPLIILILTNKNLEGKQKGVLAGVAIAALVVAGIFGFDFDPPSIEQYTEQTQRVEWLNQGHNSVYWTPHGTVYHLYDDCSHITGVRTSEIFLGTVAQARELKNITHLCSRCENRAIRERDLDETEYVDFRNRALETET